MTNIQYAAGQKAARGGGWRAAPQGLKILSAEWRAWYAGFDAAKSNNEHPNLTASGGLRKGKAIAGRSL